jgi:Endoglucanase
MRIFTGYQKGVDLGGWFSQCDHTEERYDTFITASDFAAIQSWGCDHVRLPVDYDLLEDKYGAPREKGYERLERAVGWARANGLNMVLDLHKTAGFSFDPGEQEAGFFENEKYQERFCALWERIARRFGRYSSMLAFELLNEVTEQKYGPVWNRIAAECVRRIRAYAPDVKILIGGYWHNSAAAVKDLPAPFDENIVYNFHCYEPLIFTHQGAYWEAPYRDISPRYTYAESGAGEEYFEDFLRPALEKAEKEGTELYCGEYGVIDKASPEDALVWYSLIHAAFEKYGIGRAAWSYRQMDFGLSDPRMDAVRPELLRYL